jgi:hypothetical protein
MSNTTLDRAASRVLDEITPIVTSTQDSKNVKMFKNLGAGVSGHLEPC